LNRPLRSPTSLASSIREAAMSGLEIYEIRLLDGSGHDLVNRINHQAESLDAAKRYVESLALAGARRYRILLQAR
jgi:hypothetical protein